MLKKKTLICALCGILMLSSVSIPAFALETSKLSDSTMESSTIIEDNKVISTEVINLAKKWLIANYKEFYDIRNVEGHITKLVSTSQTSRYTVSLGCQTMYKYSSVEEIPFVQGLMSVGNQKILNHNEQNALNAQIESIALDAAFGEYTDLFVDVVIEIDNMDSSVPWKMYYQDGR